MSTQAKKMTANVRLVAAVRHLLAGIGDIANAASLVADAEDSAPLKEIQAIASAAWSMLEHLDCESTWRLGCAE